VVIFDNFTTLSDSITDENSNGQMRTVCTMLAKLKSTGIGSVLVHHSGKSGETFRGASPPISKLEHDDQENEIQKRSHSPP
jgi:hypothetical protein